MVVLGMSAESLLKGLLRGSEKAASIARICREEQTLFSLLVEEKSADEKNPKFLQDFKTLADVLIQETLRHDLKSEFPGLGGHIYGEETNEFTNTLGDCIYIEIQPTQKETATLLSKVLDGHDEAGALLAEEIHQSAEIPDGVILDEHISNLQELLPIQDLGVWIDPIDSTCEYIDGSCGKDDEMCMHGLRCVTVLIGVFNRKTGQPVLGIINQPFYLHIDKWQGRLYWGVDYGNCRQSNLIGTEIDHTPHIAFHDKENKPVIVTSSDDADALRGMFGSDYHVCCPPGAGHKFLNVALGVADAYLLTIGTTYRWDACGPHSVLRALGGDILEYSELMKLKEPSESDFSGVQLKYHKGEEGETGSKKWSNKKGFVAFRNKDFLFQMLPFMRK